ncbi:MAG: histidine phosphatase family protein [Paenibacillaceae bacterium]
MTQFAIVRHGVTDWNVEGRMQGHRDIPLNEAGIIQAARIAERLQQEHWDVVVFSDLQRAAQTAACIAETIGIECRIGDPRLRERNFGKLEGTTIEERMDRWGTDWKQLDHGVEGEELLLSRALNCMEEFSNEYSKQKIVIVTHGGWIRQFFKGVFPHDVLDHPNNTSLSIVNRRAEGWQCSLYNCTKHLNTDQNILG